MSGPVLKCEARALRAALALLRGIIHPRTTIPILQCVRIRRARHGATVTANNLDIEITVPLAADLPTGFDAAFDFFKLFRLLSLLPGDAEIGLQAADGEGGAFLRFPGGQYRLPFASPSDFPQPVNANLIRKNDSVTLALADDFPATLRTVSRFISTEETRYYLNGVSFFKIDGDLCLVATDGHRLCYAPLAGLKDHILAPGGVPAHPILPRELVSLLLSSKGFKPQAVQIYHEAPVARIKCAGGILIDAKLIDGSFPDVNRVIPKAEGLKLRVDMPVAPLKAALLRAAAMSDQRSKAVDIQFNGDYALIAPQYGDARDSLERVPVTGGTQEREGAIVGFNARYLLDVIDCNRGAETISLQMAAGGPNPALIEGVKASFVVMPLRESADAERFARAEKMISETAEEVPA